MARQLAVSIVILILNCVVILGAPTRKDMSIQPTAGIDNKTNLSVKLSVKRSADQNTVRKVILDDQEIEIVKAILYGFVESNGVNYQVFNEDIANGNYQNINDLNHFTSAPLPPLPPLQQGFPGAAGAAGASAGGFGGAGASAGGFGGAPLPIDSKVLCSLCGRK